MSGFLILYRRRSGERQVFEFPGADGPVDAARARLRYERDSRFRDSGIEIAAISSDSLETVMRTHSRYFRGTEVDFLKSA